MEREPTSQERTPSALLRAKYLTHKCAIIITDISDRDLARILEIVEKCEHPPHLMQ